MAVRLKQYPTRIADYDVLINRALREKRVYTRLRTFEDARAARRGLYNRILHLARIEKHIERKTQLGGLLVFTYDESEPEKEGILYIEQIYRG